MCGFIGIVSGEDACRQRLDDGLKAIRPRGVSESKLVKATECYGFCRLPTDDVANKKHQLVTEEAGVILLFNGLITNVGHLVRAYGLSEGAKTSDFICLREGLTRHGTAFLSSCRGMFACALVNGDKIVLARDTIGIKPLYYTHDADVFAFASEIKALLPLQRPIHEVMPGQIITFDKKDKTLQKNSFSYHASTIPSRRLEQCLADSIVVPTERYLAQSKKKVALLLSGGVDSSLIVQMLANRLDKVFRDRLTAFCIGIPGQGDARIAKKLAKQIGIPLVCVPLPPADILLRRLPQVVYDVESPHARVVKVALLYDVLAREIKSRDIDVVVGGEGADELFFGYQRFIDGLEPEHTEKVARHFYKGVFFNTLLQRYERVFARNLIEGRVPYLDQDVVSLAEMMPAVQKVRHMPDGSHHSKLPLRELAEREGLPEYVFNRIKVKMTRGVAGRDNTSEPDGFLERESMEMTGAPFAELVRVLYKLYYHGHLGEYLQPGKSVITEEEVMEIVKHYKQQKKGAGYESVAN